MADWDVQEGTYRTMGGFRPFPRFRRLAADFALANVVDQDYEIRQLNLLKSMVQKGTSPPHWTPCYPTLTLSHHTTQRRPYSASLPTDLLLALIPYGTSRGGTKLQR
jgi:hypothetical protein